MNLKKVFEKLKKSIIGDVSDIHWKDLDHRKVFLAVVLLIAVLALVITLIVKGTSKKPATEEGTEVKVEQQQEPVEENPLETDAYEEINTLILKYFHGLSTGDIPLVEDVVDVLSDEEIKVIEKKKDYVESYNDIVCYTKKGLEDNTFVVFASYEMKFYNIATSAPGIMALYVFQGEDGDYRIFNGDASEELTDYVLQLAAEDDVASVIADVDARYQQLVEENEDLGKFAQAMLEAQKDAESSTETQETDTAAEVDNTKELSEPVKTTVNDGIRIREGHSTDSRMLATIISGTEVKVYASYEDGWSKIEYSGTVGFCKTEFLTSTEGVPMLPVETQTEEPAQETQDGEEPANNDASVTAVNKKMQFKESVRIRAERSTDSERLATGYTRELVEVIENYSDGWSKINYNGVVGYCKTEFLVDVH